MDSAKGKLSNEKMQSQESMKSVVKEKAEVSIRMFDDELANQTKDKIRKKED